MKHTPLRHQTGTAGLASSACSVARTVLRVPSHLLHLYNLHRDGQVSIPLQSQVCCPEVIAFAIAVFTLNEPDLSVADGNSAYVSPSDAASWYQKNINSLVRSV